MVKYPVPKNLHLNAAIHCATLVVTQDIDTTTSWPQAAQPDAALRNGTLTFVKSEGRTYGITCQHVVQHYRNVLKASGGKSHSMRTMVNGFYIVLDRFVQSHGQFCESDPDIAIREINSDHVAHIGKVAIDLDTTTIAPENMQHAYAVGFPERMKYNKCDDGVRYRVSMPQLQILAEMPRRPDRRFTMFSELPSPAIAVDYSGMSGGPIFWTTENDYGILGIIYEGGPGDGNNSIYVYGELATPETIKSWIAQCCPLPM